MARCGCSNSCSCLVTPATPSNITVTGNGSAANPYLVGGGGHDIQDEGVLLPDRLALDFVGPGVVVTDDLANNKSIVTVQGSAIAVQEEGVTITPSVTQFDFVGSGVSAALVGGEVVVTVPGESGAGTLTVQDENATVASAVTQIDFQGGGVSAALVGGEVVVTIPAGGTSNVKSTVGAGLPALGDRLLGDFHYNTTDQKEYVVSATDSVSSQTNGSSAGTPRRGSASRLRVGGAAITVARVGVGSRESAVPTAGKNKVIEILDASRTTVLATTAVITVALSTSDGDLGTTFALATPVTLAANTEYHIGVRFVSPNGADNMQILNGGLSSVLTGGLVQPLNNPRRLYIDPAGNGTFITTNALADSEYEMLYTIVAQTLVWTPDWVVALTRAVSTTQTLLSTDQVILASNAITLTLPSVASFIGKRLAIKNTTATTLTIVPGSGTIDGAANKVLTVQYSSIDLVTDGTNWWEI